MARMGRKGSVIAVLLVILGLVTGAPTRVSVDLKCARVIGGKGTWSTSQFNVIHFKLPGRDAPDSAVNYLLTNLGVKMGRTGRGPFRVAKKYFDMPYSRGLAGMRREGTKAVNWVLRDPRMSPANRRRWENDEVIMSDEAELIDYLDRTGKTPWELGRFVSNYLKFFNNPSRGAECPRFYEPINEGMNYQWKKTNRALRGRALNRWKVAQLKKVAVIHREVCRSIKSHMADQPKCRPLCGGWAAGWVDFSSDSFRVFRERLKTYVDEAGRDSDFISLHTYDSIKTSHETKTSGGFIDNVLDLTQTYLRNSVGFKPIVISEYGAASNQVWFKEQANGVKKALPYCASRDFYIIHSVTAQMMQYSFYPHMIIKTVPFLTLLEDIKDLHPTPWSLMRTVGGRRTWTHLVKVYEILKGVQGEYRRVTHNNPQLYVHVLSHGDEVYVLVKNMVRQSRVVNLDFVSGFPQIHAQGTELRRLYLEEHARMSQCARQNRVPRSGLPKLTSRRFRASDNFGWMKNFQLRPEEFVVIKLALKRTPEIAKRTDVNYWYANSYIKPVSRNSSGWTPPREFVFNDKLPEGVGRATIRVGLAAFNTRGVQCRVHLNNKLVTGRPVPSGPEAGPRSRWIMLEYFTGLQNVKPPAGRKTTVKVSCTLYQGQISTVTIMTEKERSYGGGGGASTPDRYEPARPVVNGNFERGLKGWKKSTVPAPSIYVVKPPTYRNHVVRIEDRGVVSQTYRVTAGVQYELSAQVRTPLNRMSCSLSVRILNESDKLVRREQTETNSTTWSRERVMFTTPRGMNKVTILLASWNRNNVCLYDNVMVRRVRRT